MCKSHDWHMTTDLYGRGYVRMYLGPALLGNLLQFRREVLGDVCLSTETERGGVATYTTLTEKGCVGVCRHCSDRGRVCGCVQTLL